MGQVEGCSKKLDARWYIGKRCAYVYKAKNKTPVPGSDVKTQMRCIWGKVTRTHGNAGSVRAKFARNLPPQAMGQSEGDAVPQQDLSHFVLLCFVSISLE